MGYSGTPFAPPGGYRPTGYGFSAPPMPQIGGSGNSWSQWLPAVGSAIAAGAGIYGAYNQNQANQQNFAAQQQQNAMMQQYVQQLMMSGQNPYAGAMAGMASNFSSQGSGGFTGMPQAPAPQPNQRTGGAVGQIIRRMGPPGSGLGPGASPNVNMLSGMQQPVGQELSASGIPVPTGPVPGGGYTGPSTPDGGGQGPGPSTGGDGLLPGMRWNVGQLGRAPQMTGATIGPVAAGVASLAGMPTTGEAFNSGQDGLLQSMRRDVGLVQDPAVAQGLGAAISGNTRFDNSDLFGALGALDERALNKQVTALQGSAGSFGQRFGTALNQNEAQLRGDFTAQAQARNAQLQAQAFEAAQGRSMQGLGMGLNQQQFATQAGLQNAQLQQGAAGQLAGLGMQQQQLGMQNNQFNAGAQNQMAMQNQQIMAQIAQMNAQNQQQAGLANQALAGQYGLAQFGAENDAGRFNAGNSMGMYQFGQGQRMSYDQMAMQALAQAQQAQMGQNQYNAGLVGMLAGLPLPTQMPSAMPGAIMNAGMLAMLYPQLRNM